MAWKLITPELADSLLGRKELAAISTHLEIDARADILRRVVSKVRGYCAGSGELGPEGSIPDECEDAVAALYRYALLSSLPTSTLITEARIEEKKSAENFLTKVAKGEVGISRPTTVAVPSSGISGGSIPAPTISAGTRRRDRAGLDGS